MRRLMLGMLILAGCGGSQMPTSGVAELDQTADFLRDVVTGLRNSKRLEKASDIAAYLVSAEGKAEYWPPSPEFEKQAADNYSGKRPADGVAVWDKRYDIGEWKYYILVSADEGKGVVVLDAFDWTTDEKLYSWQF